MDWSTIATVLGERIDEPLVVLDRTGRIRLLNRAMEGVLGWSRLQVEGAPWSRFVAPVAAGEPETGWLNDALRGVLRTYESAVLTKAGAVVLLRLELSLVGRGASQSLLATATDRRPLIEPRGTSAGREYDYEMCTGGDRFGSLLRLSVNGEPVPGLDARKRCYRVLYALESPCVDCPASTSAAPWPRTVVRATTPADSDAFELTTATRIADGRARVRTRTLSASDLALLHQARIDQAADRARLSSREREVLNYLLLGRNNEEIAALVGIAVRTVKHHQAKLLEKLGADSRSDLMRVLF